MGDILNTQIGNKSFDPARGCQEPSTGLVGAFFILALAACYAFYLQKMSFGGPKIPIIHTWLPKDFQFKGLNRTYADVMFMVVLCFLFMLNWEFLRVRILRALTLVLAVLGLVFLTWFMRLQGGFGGLIIAKIFWTRFDLGLFAIGILLLIPWLLSFFVQKWRLVFSSPLWALRTAFWRWLAAWLLFALVMVVVFYHPFYKNNYYENWRITCGYLFGLYTFFGLPYAFVTNWLRGHRFEDRTDPGFILLLLGRSCLLSFLGKKKLQIKRQLKNRRVGIVLRDLLVKFFWIPLMVTFLFIEAGNFFNILPQFVTAIAKNFEGKKIFDLFYFTTYRGFFVIDVTLGLIGYACSSRWLGNKSKSVDPTLSGWLVAIMCYPPFNGITEGYLPYHGNFGPPFAFWNAEWIDVCFKLVTLFMFLIYVWATTAFGLRFSNVTHRGIITRGPYAYMRHPAYFAKNVAWWTESVRAFVSPWQFLFIALWNYIYYLRAMTEERHLRQDPDYVAYAHHVRARFIPKIW